MPHHRNVLGFGAELAAEQGEPELVPRVLAAVASPPVRGGDLFILAEVLAVGLQIGQIKDGEPDPQPIDKGERSKAQQVGWRDHAPNLAAFEPAGLGRDPLDAVAEAELLHLRDNVGIAGEQWWYPRSRRVPSRGTCRPIRLAPAFAQKEKRLIPQLAQLICGGHACKPAADDGYSRH